MTFDDFGWSIVGMVGLAVLAGYQFDAFSGAVMVVLAVLRGVAKAFREHQAGG